MSLEILMVLVKASAIVLIISLILFSVMIVISIKERKQCEERLKRCEQCTLYWNNTQLFWTDYNKGMACCGTLKEGDCADKLMELSKRIRED